MPLLLAFKNAVSKVLLVSGQSNAAGSDTAADLPPHLTPGTPDAGIKIWNGSAFVTLHNGVNNNPIDYPSNEYWGPNAQFSYRFRQDHPGETLYIIIHAIGGMAISNWDPAGSGNIFTEMETHVTNAFAALVNPQVVGMIYMEGETDAQNSGLAAAYSGAQATFLTAALTRWRVGTVPIMLGRITTFRAFSSTVRAAQDAAASSQVRVINTDSYPLQPDGEHYTGAGQVMFGDDCYDAWL